MQMNDPLVVTQQSPGITILQINRPEQRNALNLDILRQLATSLTSAANDDAVRVVIVTGNARAFAAGADVTELVDKTPIDMVQSERLACWEAIRSFPKPVIAAVSGWCLGGGNELALSCDIVVASETARFGQPEINLGLMPGAGGTQRLTRAVGKAVAMEMMLAGRYLTAHEALQYGLINTVASSETYLEPAIELAHVLASKSPLALRFIKQAILKAWELPLNQGQEFERTSFHLLLGSADTAEGIAAFLENRSPLWKAR